MQSGMLPFVVPATARPPGPSGAPATGVVDVNTPGLNGSAAPTPTVSITPALAPSVPTPAALVLNICLYMYRKQL